MSLLPQSQMQWTVNNEDGQPIVNFTSFISAEIVDEGHVVSGPVEEGSFVSYNKVDTPLDVRVTLGFQGTDDELQDAILKLEEYRFGTDLVSLVTPVAEYESLNLEKFSYQLKRENGVGVLYAELFLIEIIQVGVEYADVKLAPKKDRGKVQTKNVGGDGGSASTTSENKKKSSVLKSIVG